MVSHLNVTAAMRYMADSSSGTAAAAVMAGAVAVYRHARPPPSPSPEASPLRLDPLPPGSGTTLGLSRSFTRRPQRQLSAQTQVTVLTDRWQLFHFEVALVDERILDAVPSVDELETVRVGQAHLRDREGGCQRVLQETSRELVIATSNMSGAQTQI